MKKSLLFIASLLVFGSSYSQMQPAIQLENLKPAKNCFENYYNAFALRGANPVPDGEQNVVLSLRQNDSCTCVEGKVTVKNGLIVPNVLVKKVDGSYEPARRTLDSRTNSQDHSLGNPFSISNGMSQTFSTADYAVVNMFFIDYLKAKPVAVAVAPNPDDIDNKPAPPPAKESTLSEKEKAIIKKAYDGLKFQSGSAKITPASYQYLDLLASMLTGKSSYQLALNGYTDNVGNAESNLKLSDARANAVKDYLVKKGCNAAFITAKGFGVENPIADNATAAGRAKNRRVDFIVTE
jgi:outer membrane protein OmpA-like peptidoglycan-associated protein